MTLPLELSAYTLLAVLGLAAITLLTRGFFLLPRRDWPLPPWLHQGLRYAPLAALAAVVAPELVPAQAQASDLALLLPRLAAALAGAAWYYWRRGILGTIVCGVVVLQVLRLAFGA